VKTKLIDFCRESIRTKSLSGREDQMAALVAGEMKKLGYDEVTIDDYGSVIGKINGAGEKSVLFEGHMDTVDVPAGDQWSVDPFGGEMKDDRLYGRGSADMKSALAAMIYGAAELIGQRERLHGDVYVCAVVFEETLEGVAFGKILDTISPDWVVLGEPSGLKLALGQKGRAEIVIKTTGKNAHSATPEHGVNAIDAMHTFISRVNEIPFTSSRQLGKGILEITDIISSPYPGSSVIPNYCRATYDRRLIEGESEEMILKPFKKIIEKLKREDSDFEGTASIEYAAEKTYTGALIESSRFFPGWIIDTDATIVKAALDSYSRLGFEAEICYYPFCTDGSESAGKRNIPTIGIGPAPPEMAHTVDEHVRIGDIIKVKNLYREIALSLLE
jgi:putative selenium metabolism hydrolase